MNYLPCKKKTFLKVSGSADDSSKKHLFCILTDVVEHSHYVVPICSVIPGRKHDNTCLLELGDHPFIIRPSYVAYQFITSYHTTTIIKCMSAGTFIKKEDLESNVFNRIYNGVSISHRTPGWAINAHRSWPKN
jgi:hypothetical protein